MKFRYFSKNGIVLPIDQATVSLFNIEYSYGFGVYETLKVRNGKVYFIEQHLERLEHSAQIINLTHQFAKEYIKQYMYELLKQHGTVEACNIKLLLIGARKKEDTQLYIFLSAPLFPDRKLYTHGAKTITQHYQRMFPNAKTLNMLGSYLAYTKAQSQGCYDALLIDEQEHILEGTRTNFFAIKGTTLYTPPTEQVLEGVTRITVIQVARQNGFDIQEAKIALSEIPTYQGAFLTSTSTKIMPVKQIDEFVFEKIPAELKELMKLYDIFLDTA